LFRIRHQQVFVCTVLEELQERTPGIAISIQDINHNNISRVTDFRDEAITKSFERLLDVGQVGIYAIADSKIVGHAWAIICRGKKRMANGYFKLNGGEALIHFCNVKATCRGRDIYPFMLFALCKRLFNEKRVSKVFVDTEIDNTTAIRSIQKVAFKPIGRYLYFQFKGRLVYKKNVTITG
jgi:hypothetical protein